SARGRLAGDAGGSAGGRPGWLTFVVAAAAALALGVALGAASSWVDDYRAPFLAALAVSLAAWVAWRLGAARLVVPGPRRSGGRGGRVPRPRSRAGAPAPGSGRAGEALWPPREADLAGAGLAVAVIVAGLGWLTPGIIVAIAVGAIARSRSRRVRDGRR
ncbi:MAG: hypothetical protein ACRD0L_01455, partial [Acidimicrobiales bacterium]